MSSFTDVPVPFEISVDRRGGAVTVLGVCGDLDAETSLRLSQVMSAELEPVVRLVVDLTGVTVLGSAGIAVLLGSHRRATGGRDVRIVAPTPLTSEPITLLGLDTTLHVFATLEEALAGDGHGREPRTIS